MDTIAVPTQAGAVPGPEAPPPLRLTAQAVAQVKLVCQQQGFQGHHLSVRVVPSGCSGFGYDLNLIKDARPGDVTWEQDGVMIATDAGSARYLRGTEVDYVTGMTGTGFKFLNPNAKSSCGCGSSFNT
ncbi:MAG TPA: iron-sulfur cluster assembly accessory protein [Myxococcales bacterium]|nr:iron-sulfur cluster assembly accessory protein [Myxococcales bacterium]